MYGLNCCQKATHLERKMKIDKKCHCGLIFMDVDWLHHRIRGWCSYQCRKKYLLNKREIRLQERQNKE